MIFETCSHSRALFQFFCVCMRVVAGQRRELKFREGGVWVCDQVYALNASTGQQVWAFETEGSVDRYHGQKITSSPAVADGMVFVASYFTGKVRVSPASQKTLERVRSLTLHVLQTGGDTCEMQIKRRDLPCGCTRVTGGVY